MAASTTSSTSSWTATAAALPRKSAGPSSPERRRPSRAPLSASMANDARDREQRGQEDGHPEQAGGDPAQDAPVGVEREREEQEHDEPERDDLLRGDPGPGLDPEVLARHEPHLTPEVHATTSARRVGRVARSASGGPSRAWPAVITTSRVASARACSSSCDASSTVRCSAGARAHDLVEHLATLGVEPGVRLVEQEQPRIARQRDRDREAAALTRRQPAVHDVGLAVEPEPLERGIGVADVAPGGARREPEVLAHGQVVVAEGLVPDEREVTPGAAAVDGEIVSRAPWPPRSTAAPVRPAAGATWSSRRRSLRTSRTISPAATSRSTPASAGKRPRRQTAERRRTTAGTLASGRSMDRRVYGDGAGGGRTGAPEPRGRGR